MASEESLSSSSLEMVEEAISAVLIDSVFVKRMSSATVQSIIVTQRTLILRQQRRGAQIGSVRGPIDQKARLGVTDDAAPAWPTW